MKSVLRKILTVSGPGLDVLFFPATLLSTLWLKLIRKFGVSRLPLSRGIFRGIGIYPIKDHYYEPLFNTKKLKRSLREDRILPGIQWQLEGQKSLLSEFNYQDEILAIKKNQGQPLRYSFTNDTFAAGDSEFLYNIVRHFKPRRLIEVGSGNSTLMTIEAIRQNQKENPSYVCQHICIEPFERPWLEKLNIQLVRQLVENVDKEVFRSLEANDILFIDSSHIIRPQGDVLCEYLEILPSLKPGVLVHVHDIFSPKDYLDAWLMEDMKLWNEQYLLEAFLSHNHDFKIIGALNFLKYKAPKELSASCPVFGEAPENYEPGSFWMQKLQ